MPRPLIEKLKELCAITITVRPTPEKNLSDITVPVDKETSDKVEEIERLSIEVFGPNKEPSRREKSIMEKLGFKVTPFEVDNIGWKKAQIQTPVGTIVY